MSLGEYLHRLPWWTAYFLIGALFVLIGPGLIEEWWDRQMIRWWGDAD